MGLNCKSPFIHGFFSVVNSMLLHDLQLVESAAAVPWIQRNCEYGGPAISCMDFTLWGGGVPLTLELFMGQLYSVFF